MRHWIWIVTAATCLSAFSLAVDIKPAQADEYWDGYWSWYDGTYRPYYSRRAYSPYTYGYPGNYSSPYGYSPYGGNYYPGDGYYYGRRYGDYYGTPNVGYGALPGGAGQVRVGPLRFGWR